MPHARAEWQLADAFAAAHYHLTTPRGTLTLQFDPRTREPAPPTNALPRGTWAIVAAANPWSIPMSDPENAARTRELAALLTERALASRPARNTAPDGQWSEGSFLIERISRDETLALCRRFGQAAAVFGIGPKCGLLWTRTERWVILPATIVNAP